MKKYLAGVLITAAALGYIGCNVSKKSLLQNEVEFILNTVPMKAGRDTSRLILYTKIDTIQKQKQECLKFSIVIINKTDTALRIRNVTEYFDFKLLNDSGFNFLYPNISKAFIHRVSTAGKIDKSFLIEKITINGSVADAGIMDDEFMIIPPKERFEIFVSVTKLLKPGAIKPYDLSEGVTTIPKGKYQFLLGVPVYEGTWNSLWILNPAVTINIK